MTPADVLAMRQRLKARMRRMADEGRTLPLSLLCDQLREQGMQPFPRCRTWHIPATPCGEEKT